MISAPGQSLPRGVEGDHRSISIGYALGHRATDTGGGAGDHTHPTDWFRVRHVDAGISMIARPTISPRASA